jgi:hypothetical protein
MQIHPPKTVRRLPPLLADNSSEQLDSDDGDEYGDHAAFSPASAEVGSELPPPTSASVGESGLEADSERSLSMSYHDEVVMG